MSAVLRSVFETPGVARPPGAVMLWAVEYAARYGSEADVDYVLRETGARQRPPFFYFNHLVVYAASKASHARNLHVLLHLLRRYSQQPQDSPLHVLADAACMVVY
jgi:hypothetical protein